MGKPYSLEMEQLHETYHWALEVPIDMLQTFIKSSYNKALISVGSGGSLTAAHFLSLLHESSGAFAKTVTPMELIEERSYLRNSNVLFLSAGGKNSDILTAFKVAASSEPRQLMALCAQVCSPLVELAKKFQYSSWLGFDLPSGKDGFLATNSLLAFVTILIRAYQGYSAEWNLSNELLSLRSDWPLQHEINTLLNRDTFVVLYGRWGFPAANDAESKFTEAALGHIQTSDYRNFAHGRHHWFAKRSNTSGIIALVTPDEKIIAERTLEIMPRNIPRFILSTEYRGPLGGLDLLANVMQFVNVVGRKKGIDPGRPGVPEFGRKIYHLRIAPAIIKKPNPVKMTHDEVTAITRKIQCPISLLSSEELIFWKSAYEEFLRNLKNTRFGGIVFDYDGTLCSSQERFIGPSKEIIQEILRLLESGCPVGIATGRGQSVRKVMQKEIPQRYWKKIILGYYNGAEIASLECDNCPDTTQAVDISLREFQKYVEASEQLRKTAKIDLRPKQLTVSPVDVKLWVRTKQLLFDLISKFPRTGVRLVESSHSIDILAPGVSKINLIESCKQEVLLLGRAESVLCIGDRGQWPGNDFELLATPYSLSVDVVSSDPKTCWNLAPSGHKGVQATLYYLKFLKTVDENLRFNLKESR